MTEQLPYDLLAKIGDLELRHYPPHVLVQASSKGEFMRAGNRAFNPLLQYISGANVGGQKIAMTAPVLQESKSPDDHLVSFVMPADFKISPDARPLSSSLSVVPVDEHFAAVIKFRGSWDSERFAAFGQELSRRVKELGLTALGDVYWARFDPPFKPGFMKRNEVLIKISNPTKEIREHQSTTS